MIRRFTLLSVALHVSVGAALIHGGVSHLAARSTDLQATLVESHVAGLNRSAPANRARRPATDAPLLVTRSAAAAVAAMPAGATAHVAPDRGNDEDDAATGSQKLVNHLLTELRAAFDAGFIYPPLARRHGWQGQVQLGLTVGADGRLSDLCVLSSSGYPVLDEDAVRTLARIGTLARASEFLAGRSVRLQLPVLYRLIQS